MFSETVKRSVLPFIASVHATGHATVSLRCHVAFHRTRSIPPLRQCNATFALLRIGPEHWSAEIARPCRGARVSVLFTVNCAASRETEVGNSYYNKFQNIFFGTNVCVGIVSTLKLNTA